jgi:perosamine synthetase
MARDALSLAANCLRLDPHDVVVLPAFLCREVLRPFVGRSRLIFYDVGDDLTVQPDTIERLIERDRVRLVVTINYFGALQRFRKEIGRICAERGVVLLEDCAHSFLTSCSGDTGDMAVVSYRKLLPVFDGGGLRIKKSVMAVAPDLQFQPNLFADAMSVLATVKAATGLRSSVLSRAGLADVRPMPTPTNVARVLPLSRFARNGVGNASIAEIIEQRRRDYEFWRVLLSVHKDVTSVLGKLDSGVCPTGFPILAANRDAMLDRLWKLAVPAHVQWTLSPNVGSECSNSHRLSRQIMTLPIYPELTTEAKAKVEASWSGARQR